MLNLEALEASSPPLLVYIMICVRLGRETISLVYSGHSFSTFYCSNVLVNQKKKQKTTYFMACTWEKGSVLILPGQNGYR